MRFVILGAGLSGLSCGLGLLEAGHEVVILEKEAYVGGLCRTLRRDGYASDFGPHFLFGDRVVDVLSRRLAPSLSIPSIRRTGERIFTRNRLFHFPFDPRSILRNMEKDRLLLAMIDLVVTRALSKRAAGTDLETWTIQAVGKTIYQYIDLSGYVEKLYSLPAREISAEWGRQKLKFLSAWRDRSMLTLGLQALNEKKRLKRKVVSYPKSGIDVIPLALATRFREAGGEIKTSVPIARIAACADRVEVATSARDVVDGDFLLSSAPLPAFVSLLSEEYGESLSPFLARLRQRKTVFFFLYFDKPAIMAYPCVYFTEPRFRFRRVTEFKGLSEAMAPAGKSSLCVEVTVDQDETPDTSQEMVDAILVQLDQTGCCDIGDFVDHEVMIVPNTYPVYGMAYAQSLREVLTRLSPMNRVMTFGRQGLFFYNTMNNAIMDGYRLGKECIDGRSFSSLREASYRRRLTLSGATG